MSVARHARSPELVDVPIEEIMQRYVGRFRAKKPDWAAFEDAGSMATSARSTASLVPVAQASTTIRP